MFNESSSQRTFITICILALTLAPPASPSRETRGQADRPTTLVHPPFKHNLGFNRLRQFHLDAYGGPGHVIDSPAGIAAVKLRFKDSEGAGDDDEVTVFGVNAGQNEIVYNPSLMEIAFFGDSQMVGPGFDNPVGVAAAADGLVAVGDRGNDRVVLLQVDSRTRLAFLRSVTLAESPRPLSQPGGVAIAGGLVYVADGGNDRIVAFDTAGVARVEFRRAGLRNPFDVAVIDRLENRNGATFLVVVDRDRGRLTTLDLASGRLLESCLYSEVTGGDGEFGFVAIDYDGNVFVTDPGTGCVYKFDSGLGLLARFECDGEPFDELDHPAGIAINRRFGQVFIAESTGVSYYWIGTDVTGLRARFTRSDGPLGLEVRFVLTERSLVDVGLETRDGEQVETLSSRAMMDPGPRRLVYRIEESTLRRDVADCTYRVRVRARATYSSKKHFEAEKMAPVR